MSRKMLVGMIGVDSGTLVVGDPSYFDQDGTPNGKDFTKLFESKDGALVLEDLGAGVVLLSPGFGDGYYPVYATITDYGQAGERIERLEIVFIGEQEIKNAQELGLVARAQER